MTLSSASAVAFALTGGYPSDVRDWITVDLPPPTSRRRGRIVAVEPVARTYQTLGLAKRARELMSLQLELSGPAETIIGRAFAAANTALNEEKSAGDAAFSGVPLLLGATAAVIEDEVATIAYAPPAQSIIVQDGLVYGLPALESWLPVYAASPDQAASEPLGYSSWVAPRVVQTELRPGDTIIVCSAGLGEVFASEIAEAGLCTSDLTYLFGQDPELVLDMFRGLAIRDDLRDASVAVIGYPPAPGSVQVRTLGDIRRRARQHRQAASAEARRWLPAPTSSRTNGVPAALAVESQAEPETADEAIAVPPLGDDGATGLLSPSVPNGLAVHPRDSRDERLHHLQGHAQSALDRMNPKWKATWQRPAPVREFGVPGAHGVRLYRGSAGAMGEPGWRNKLPRIPFYRTLLTTLIVVLCLAAIVGVGGLAKEQFFPDRGKANAALAATDQHMAAASHATDNGIKDSELKRAEHSLATAKREGASSKAVAARAQEITRQRDALSNIIRFKNVTRLGSLPADLQTTPIEIVRTSSGIFAAGGGLYQLKPGSPEMVRVLKQGETIPGGKQVVGSLWGVSVDVNGLYAVDGKHAFVLDNDGKWSAVVLDVIPSLQPWKRSPTGAFGGNVYLLVPSYRQVYKFPPPDKGSTDSQPVDWVRNEDRTDLNHAVDFVVDGNIYILMDDGRVLTYYKNALVRQIAPQRLSNGKPLALAGGGGDNLLYMLVSDGDGQSGRILCFDKEGKQFYQLRLPPGFSTGDTKVSPPFAGVEDFAVDEGTGTVYLFTKDAIWTAQFQVPPIATPAKQT